jgi:hypothetical protein
MADPLTLAVLGGVAATEGIKFLYGQASELLKVWRDRRRASAAGEPLQTIQVPIIDNSILDASPVTDAADATVIEHAARELVQLTGALSLYAQGVIDVDVTDVELNEYVRRLRSLLEAAYGQRFTFRGEERERTGSRVTVTQVLGDVRGAVTGVEAGEVGKGMDLIVDQDAQDIAPDGSLTGVRAQRIGEPTRSTDKSEN